MTIKKTKFYIHIYNTKKTQIFKTFNFQNLKNTYTHI